MFRNRIATDQYRIRGHSMVFLSGLQVEEISESSYNYINNIWLSIIRHGIRANVERSGINIIYGIPSPRAPWRWARACP